MTPAASSGGGSKQQDPIVADETAVVNGNGDQGKAPAATPKDGPKNNQKGKKTSEGAPKGDAGPNSGKPSGKELKERAKAEKQAKRAKEREGKQGQPVADFKGGNIAPEPESKIGKSPGKDQPPSKSHQRRRSSAGAHAQKPLPLRPAAAAASVPKVQETLEEDNRVPLLEHLYGHPRRTTIAGASKDVHPSVLALGLQIGAYEICGSNARCVAMLLVFQQVISSYTTPVATSLPRHLTTHLSSQIDYLISYRPLSVSQGNAIRWLKVAISAVDISTPEEQAKSDLCIGIDNFIREKISVADQVIAASGAERIKDGDVIMTYAKSSIVEKTLAEAFYQGKRFKVVVIDSHPLYEGRNLARALVDLGVEVQYSLINGLAHVVGPVTKTFLGAHAMMSNGRLYSRLGTAMVAMMAKDVNSPVMVCCESVKVTDRVALDSFVHNEIAPEDELLPPRMPENGQNVDSDSKSLSLYNWRKTPNLQLLNLMYDLTPAEMIDVVITEAGSMPPNAIAMVQSLTANT
ncbi:MAG: hypothetical protein OHK93_008599 [Ramalina farinacea]|uniref:Translation initiation factor eIF2B subunit delta n=1 Tax=Ramalina farinacea TaxID=258253 RepID=A0AA43QMR6_9LECA|nr:hypothetical protein [Ramalina farinacea]